jgi:hypothetical protein
VFSQLRDEKLENGLALLVDVFKRLNNWMVIFQNKFPFLQQICIEVQPFRLKQLLLPKQITKNKFAHYSTYGSSSEAQKCRNILSKLCEEFCKRIEDFKESRNLNPIVDSSFLLQIK